MWSYTEQSLQEQAGLIEVNMSKCEPHVQKKDEKCSDYALSLPSSFYYVGQTLIWWGECGQLTKKFNFIYHTFVILRQGAVKNIMEAELYYDFTIQRPDSSKHQVFNNLYIRYPRITKCKMNSRFFLTTLCVWFYNNILKINFILP